MKRIIIVGGGTAGWLTAGTLAAKIKESCDMGPRITLVESPNVPIVGVGEGTWPTMRNTLRKMGIRETDFIRECDVSFKQGAKFAKWTSGADNDFYYHPLILPQDFNHINLAPHWLDQGAGQSFSEAVCPQEALCELGLAPKLITTPEYASVANYAYHLNAGTFSKFLQKHCVDKLGIEHILDDVLSVNSADNGDIRSLSCASGSEIDGDLFIDCSGFKSLLLGQHYQVAFKSCKDTLFLDTALAVQVPYPDENSAIASHTISTAQDAGWIWDIGLSSRRGVGHVYASDYCSEQEAADKLRAYVKASGADADKLDYKKILIQPGHREKFWHKNCVAIGLSAGFLEPLEASALVLVEMSAQMIAEQLPANRAAMSIVAKRFNKTFSYRWQRIIDFLKLHYIVSKRDDHDFWIDNRNKATIPDSLQELMELWTYQSPWHDDFDHAAEVFPAASYQYVLYGMGFETQASFLERSESRRKLAMESFQKNKMLTQQLVQHLPTNRELINKIKEYGLQKV
ncbi:tryptophan halogenase family protein [Agaribacterium haliotis]|uniref:tryptophan halogenase family protein n=1 Tax=Agaribacterium haliotis TaxID=2013869 RepID=UPI001EFE8C02|nr:tryptophan halogenase family protein [Agaribacterium haliotis]